METFPESLPQPAAGLNWRPSNATIRSTMDSGRSRQRSRFSTTFYQAQVTWEFSDAELLVFKAFFRDDIYNGAAWCEMELPLGGGYQTFVVRFTDNYVATNFGAIYWRVTATLETATEPGTVSEETPADEGFDFFTEGGAPVPVF